MSSRSRTAISVAEYEAIGEDNGLVPRVRTELLDGEVFEMPPIGISHAWLVTKIHNALQRLCGENAITYGQNPVLLDGWSMPEPDVTLLMHRADEYRLARPTPADILLVVEVSDTTWRLDRGKKLALYAAANVARVWIVNVAAHRIFVFDSPVGSMYTNEAEWGPGDTVEVPGVSDPVPVADLIGE